MQNYDNYHSMSRKITVFFKNILKAVIPLAIGLLIFRWVYREMDFSTIREVLQKGVHAQWIILSLFFCAWGEIIRALRWKQLIIPLSENPRTSNVIFSVFINYLINLILPRMGEISRCAVINKYEKISFTKTIGTLITERIVDLFSLMIVMLIAFLLQFNDFFAFFAREVNWVNNISSLFSSVWLYVGLIVTVFLFWVVWTQFQEAVFIRKFKQATKNVWTGVKTIRQVNGKFRFGCLTLFLWLIYFLQFYLCVFAFDFSANLTPLQGLFIFVMANIGIVIPVQGGIGPWHFMVIRSMVFFGISGVEAAAFALLVHGSQMVFSILLGIVGVITLPLNNKRKRH